MVIETRLVVNGRQLHTDPRQQLRSEIQRYGPLCIHPPCSNMPQTTVAHPSDRDEDDRWRLKIQSTDNYNTCQLGMSLLLVNTRYGICFKIILKTYTHTRQCTVFRQVATPMKM